MPRRVLILSASAGAGHVRAAEALEAAFSTIAPDVTVENRDVLQSTTSLFRKLYSDAYLEMVNRAPEVLGWLYDRLDEPWKNEKLRSALERMNTRKLVRMIEETEPDAIVCTHFLPGSLVSWLKAKGRVSAKLAIVVTDFDVHAMWLCHNADRYFVALDETRVHLEALGIPPGRAIVSGIPVHPRFAEAEDQRASRVRLGLDPGLTTILVSAGGFGVGPVEHLLTALMKLRQPAQVVMICGRNEELRARLTSLVSSTRGARTRVHLIGFTTEMHAYMSAADLMVGKPGGLTTSEALAKGLAIVVVNPIPGQEERNSDHLLEKGVAIRSNNLPAIGWKIDELLADPARLAKMRELARALGRPHAARSVAEETLRMLTENEDDHACN
jgi:UDP-N-acetylglucosamine:LPS N-acetylglucosamine transferase